MEGIIRVFCEQTTHTPTDDYCFIGEPGLFIPPHKQVHISCVFTWQKPQAEYLAECWRAIGAEVKIGGPAFDDPGGGFAPGMYVRSGITFTSRGCPNNCKFCHVPRREGKIRELDIKAGSEIQDNNFLACSKHHRQKVYDMLRTQKAIRFVGGLESNRLTDWDIEEMRKLRIKELWMACDTKWAVKTSINAISRLAKAGFSQNHIRCYVLIGDDITENENRLRTVYESGALPFAQLYQPEQRINYSKEWQRFARIWSRPALMRRYMRMESEGE